MSSQTARLTQSYIVRFVHISGSILLNHIFLPYAAGLLEAYVKRHAENPSRYTFMPPLYQRKTLKKAVQEFQYVDIAAFSIYCWNEQYALALARELKKQRPDILIIFGGPQVPKQTAPYLEAHPFIDVCALGEGEATFLNLLEAYPQNDWQAIPGVAYRDQTGHIVSHPEAPRVNNLAEIPSPYLTGVFEPLLKTSTNHEWAGFWETNRGCPFSCSFCDWGVINTKVFKFDMDRVRQEATWLGVNKIGAIYLTDANFGIFKRDIEVAEIITETYRKYKHPFVTVVQGSKNTTERNYQVLKMIYEAGLLEYVNLSLQTINPLALKHIQRENISLDTYRVLQRRFLKDKVPTYSEFLIGLPGDSYETFADGISQVISEGQHSYLRFYDVQILPNAEMGDPAYQQEHGIETVRGPMQWHMDPNSDNPEPQIQEIQEIIIKTNTMSSDDWLRMKCLGWMVDIVYYNRKFLQIPMMLIHQELGISYRKQFEAFLKLPNPEAPIFDSITAFLRQKAEDIRAGRGDTCRRVGMLGKYIMVRTTDYILMGLDESEALDAFYTQAEILLSRLIASILGPSKIPRWLSEAFQFNQALTLNQKRKEPIDITLNYNFWEYYQQMLIGEPIELRPTTTQYYSPLFRSFASGRFKDKLEVKTLAQQG